jgi:hypothetical protein
MSTYTRTAIQAMDNRELMMTLIYYTTRGSIITNQQMKVRHWVLEEMRTRGFKLSDDDIDYLTD